MVLWRGYLRLFTFSANKLAKEGTNGVPCDKTVGISFVVGKEVIKSHLRQKQLNRWKTCQGCHQSNNSICKFLPSRTKELQAVKRQKLAVGLLTDHTTLTAHVFNLRLTALGLPTVRGGKIRYFAYFMSLPSAGMQKIQNLVLYVLEAQLSRKHEGEWPNKPGS